MSIISNYIISQHDLCKYLQVKAKPEAQLSSDEKSFLDKVPTAISKIELFEVRKELDDSPVETDLHRLKVITKYLLKDSTRSAQLAKKIDFFVQSWNGKDFVSKKNKFDADEVEIIASLSDLKNLEDLPVLSEIMSKMQLLKKRFPELTSTKQNLLVFYKTKENTDYQCKVKGSKKDFFFWIQDFICRFIARWRYSHAALIISKDQGSRLVHILPQANYVNQSTPYTYSQFCDAYDFNLKPLIHGQSIDQEAVKDFERIFEKKFTNLCSFEFSRLHYHCKGGLFSIFTDHRKKEKTDYDNLSLDDLRYYSWQAAMCSELVAYAIILSIREVRSYAAEKHPGLEISYPFDGHEKLETLNPSRLYRILDQQKLLIKVETQFQKMCSI